ncbi:MAG: hypothetical protein AAFU64_08685, partial [Bacteroidota bacterium]
DFVKFIARSAAMRSKFDSIRTRIYEYVSPFSPAKTNLKQFLRNCLKLIPLSDKIKGEEFLEPDSYI